MSSFLKKFTVELCACMAVFTAIVPFARAFFHVEIAWNEGWNIYNATALVNHHLLYPVKYGWTSVNYPMLSFEILAQLHHFTHEYLFTARVLSLLSLVACSLLVAAIVKSLNSSWRSAILAGLFCFAVFCAAADIYVGMDDPQMLAQVFFLLGFLTFLRHRRSLPAIAIAALLFVVAGCIKHNPIDFPLAVLIELLLISLPRAIWFSVCSILFVSVAFLLNIRFGGPYFLSQLFIPRSYSILRTFHQLLIVIGPLLLPFCVVAYTAFKLRRDASRRITTILFLTALLVCSYFSGGKGVATNTLFSVLLAMSILLGLFWDRIFSHPWQSTHRPQAATAPLALFAWLIIPMMISGNWLTIRALHQAAAAQANFDEDVAFLKSHPGPALCESLLECNFAGKPYVYDPFNATRLIQFHKLDANVLIDQIRQHRFSAIQTSAPLPMEDQYNSERWDATVRAAIEANYVPALQREDITTDTYLDVVIYTPKPASP
jgi:hypothetical protein